MCLGIAEATESPLDILDKWRDAVVLTDAEAGGNGGTSVFLDAAEDEVWMLAAVSSFGGASRLDVLDDGPLVSCVSCASSSTSSLTLVAASEADFCGRNSVSSARLVESDLEVVSWFVVVVSAMDTGFLGRGALKS